MYTTKITFVHLVDIDEQLKKMNNEGIYYIKITVLLF